MRYIHILMMAFIIAVSSANAEFKPLYQGDERIQWHDVFSEGNTVIATGYILDGVNSFYEGQILVSTDGGNVWKSTKKSNIFLKTVAKNSENNLFIGGFAPNSNSYIFSSTNNGKSWDNILYDNTYSGITNIQFFGNTLGYATGYGFNQFMTGNIYKTTDKGTSWKSVSGNVSWINFDETYFVSENVGFAINNITGFLYNMAKTTDGGQNWTEVILKEELKADGAYFWSENEFILGGTDGRLDKTTDGGQNWTNITTNTTSQIRGLNFNGITGYAVGTGGLILKSTDRGMTWSKITTIFNNDFNNVEFAGENVFVFGEGGLILMEGAFSVGSTLLSDKTDLDFNTVETGNMTNQKITFSNNSETAINITEIKFENNSDNSFSLSSILLPVTLNKNENLEVTVNFSPKAVKSYNANLVIISDAENSEFKIPVSGEGTFSAGSTLLTDKTNLDFNSVETGSMTNQKITFSNNSETAINITEIKFENNSDNSFSLSSLILPVTLNKNENLEVTVNFSPQTVKMYNSNLVIISDAENSEFIIPLTGEGIIASSVFENAENISGMIYPNPAQDKICIDLGDKTFDSISEIKVLDINGKIIRNLSPDSELNISGIPTGSYFLLLQNGRKMYFDRFIIK